MEKLMKLLVSRDWLRTKIATDPDIETDAGAALAALEGIGVMVPAVREREATAEVADEKVVQLRMALGTLVRQLRYRDNLSIDDLAQRASVSGDELRRIEHDPHYVARPRTLYQLAAEFHVPVRNLMQLAGATRTVDRVLYNAAVKFAARSDDLSSLSEAERQLLNVFVELLNEREA
jgi:transcriptional regulator with XRE-family HTH domain